MKKNFKSGQRVRVKNNRYDLNPNQTKFAGREVTIVSQCTCGGFFIKEDNLSQHWLEATFEEISLIEKTKLDMRTNLEVDPDDRSDVIELRGEVATLFRFKNQNGPEKIRDRQVSLRDLIGKLSFAQESVVDTPLLPVGCRGYWRRGKKEVLVVEEAPRMRTILTQDRGKFILAFPYLVYVFYFENGLMPNYKSRIFYRVAPITSFSDNLLLCNLTHAAFEDHDYKIGTVCMQAGFDKKKTFQEKVNANLNYYWNTEFKGFEMDQYGAFFGGFSKTKALNPLLSSLGEWQEQSKKDPLFVLTAPWLDTGLTLKRVVEQALGSGLDDTGAPENIDQLADLIYQLGEV